MNGAQAVLESLKKEGVDVVFGYPGGAVLTLYDAVYQMNFPHVLTRHEQGAVHAADGYARATGKVGVVFATSGPGAGNLITGIATANIDSIPLVCITGQVANPYIGKDSFQEADIVGITTPITKHNYLVKDVHDLPRVLKEAFFIARTGRPGPVVIDVAKDVFDTKFDYKYPEDVALKGYMGDYPTDEQRIDEVVKLLDAAEQPLIFVGGGVTLSDTSELVRKLQSGLGAPAVSTLMGLGCLAAGTEGYLGFAGMHGAYASNMAIQQCDLLLCLGMRFSDRVTGKVAEFAPHAKIVHFEIDAAEVNKNVPADLCVPGDLRASLPLLLQKLEASPTDYREQFQSWLRHVTALADAHPFTYEPATSADDVIRPEALIAKVSELAADDTIAVTDVGQHQMWAAQFYEAKRPRHFLTSGGLGTMGFGLPAALGAKVGKPDQPVFLFTGDGSIMMNCQEFATLADNDIDVKVIVVHNFILGMVGQWQRLFYNHHYAQSELKGKTDFVKLAEAMGCKGYRLTKAGELDTLLPDILKEKGTTLIDVYVPEEEDVLPMVPGGKRLDQMVLGKGAKK
ncbi:MAG: biosynthetic-type acetolactate synthase large subunit [Selenomonas sp.]|uniref:biosynthetic-type acetolactate synthase large subunit n=1 Tax=Selenomonas sp. TaxID=2053611 RepID=UPI0025CD5F87|nr:biosynthetic-type acetolactate synthase large subunit [Selenomonas sp.]MCI6086660.1 biosynthetic-type acetolactate synthase large subunit [Selenomonas sp.]